MVFSISWAFCPWEFPLLWPMFVSRLMHVRSGSSVAAAHTKSKLADESLLEPALLCILIFIVVWPSRCPTKYIIYLWIIYHVYCEKHYVMSEIWFNETTGSVWVFSSLDKKPEKRWRSISRWFIYFSHVFHVKTCENASIDWFCRSNYFRQMSSFHRGGKSWIRSQGSRLWPLKPISDAIICFSSRKAWERRSFHASICGVRAVTNP